MPGKLVGVSRGQLGKVFWVDTTHPVNLGRLVDNHIVLEGEPTAAARHATIVWTPPHFSVQDLGSETGTFVNDVRVVDSLPLRHDDVLQLGDVRFRFQVDLHAHRMDTSPPPADAAAYPRDSWPARSAGSTPAVYQGGTRHRLTAGALAIALGPLGAHHFYLNRPWRGALFLGGSLLTCGVGLFVTVPLSLLQGVLYLVSTQEEFDRKYLQDGRFL